LEPRRSEVRRRLLVAAVSSPYVGRVRVEGR
jgi:hypothetical protein